MIRLLELPASIQDAVKSRRLSVGHAKVLLSISDPKIQSQMAAKIQAEYFSVRDLERLVAGGFETPQGVPQLSGNQKVGNPTSKVTAPQVQDMERRLTEHFGTRVSIEQSLRRGKIQIEFYSVEDFQRIISLISPNI
jgi:ParB family chromosome partitioning protein